MTVETGGFLVLAALAIGLFARLRTDIARLADGIGKMDDRPRAVERGQARLEGPREATSGRDAA